MATKKAKRFWGQFFPGVERGMQFGQQQGYRRDLLEERRKERESREARQKQQDEQRAAELAEERRLERGRAHQDAGAKRRSYQTIENLLKMEYPERAAAAIEEFKGAAPEQELFPGLRVPMGGAAQMQVPRITEPDISGMENLSGILRGRRETAQATEEAESLAGNEQQAFTMLQTKYPEVYGGQQFNPRAAEKGQYTQSLKELSVAEARPQSSAGDWLAQLLGGSIAGGGGGTGVPDIGGAGGAGLTAEEIQQARMGIADLTDPEAKRQRLKLADYTDAQIEVIMRR